MVITKIEACRNYLDDKMTTQKTPVYGINTGFEALYNIKIQEDNLSILQEKLVMSHACGMGALVPNPIVRLMFLLNLENFEPEVSKIFY